MKKRLLSIHIIKGYEVSTLKYRSIYTCFKIFQLFKIIFKTH